MEDCPLSRVTRLNRQIIIFAKENCIVIIVILTGADPGFFWGEGALVSCSTSTPTNHIGGLRTPCTLPLDPPLIDDNNKHHHHNLNNSFSFFSPRLYSKWLKQIIQINLTGLTLGRTRKFIPQRGIRGRGGWNPSSEFLIMIICSISKRFCLQWKAFDLLYKMRFIFNGWWRCWRPMTSPTMVAILDFTRN